jgi:hypothetical protein
MGIMLGILMGALTVVGVCFCLMVSVLFLDRAYYYGGELWKVVKADYEKRRQWREIRKFIKKL